MLSEKATNISPAATIEISARIAELRRQGTNIVSLNIGEPDYPTPENISQAAKSAIDAHFTKYQPVPGILELREAICKKFKTDNGLTYQPNEICVSAGAKQAVFNAVFVLCGEGDEVIIPTPCWVSYSEIVKLVGATPVYVPCAPEENFDLNLTGIRSAIYTASRRFVRSVNWPWNTALPSSPMRSMKRWSMTAQSISPPPLFRQRSTGTALRSTVFPRLMPCPAGASAIPPLRLK